MSARRYADRTEVPVERSRTEIERLLQRYGATQFMAGWGQDHAVVGFRAHGRLIKMILPLPDRNAREYTHHSRGRRTPEAAQAAWEQASRQRWRALALAIKAKLEAVESGIATFEDEWLPYTVLPTGQTVSDWLQPQIAAAYERGAMPEALPMLALPVAEDGP